MLKLYVMALRKFSMLADAHPEPSLQSFLPEITVQKIWSRPLKNTKLIINETFKRFSMIVASCLKLLFNPLERGEL